MGVELSNSVTARVAVCKHRNHYTGH